GSGQSYQPAWTIGQWLVLVGAILLAFALVYYVVPDIHHGFRLISAGTITSTVLWLLFTIGYALYVNHFAAYDKLYGVLAGIVTLMLYAYGWALILLLGAEVNHITEV